MKNNKNTLNYTLEEFLYKSFENANGNQIIVSPDIHVNLLLELEKVIGLELDIIYRYNENPICPICGLKMSKGGYSPLIINKTKEIYKQKYICKKHDPVKTHVLDLPFVDRNSNYTDDVKFEGLKISAVGYMPIRRDKELIDGKFGCNISVQSVMLHKNQKEEEYYKKHHISLDVPFSGIVGYDEEFPKVNGEKFCRLAMIDPLTNHVLNDEFINLNECSSIFEVKKEFILDMFDKYPIRVIVTDGDKAYPTILNLVKGRKITIVHQLCTFHIVKGVRTIAYKKIRWLKKRIKKQESIIEKAEEKYIKDQNKRRNGKKYEMTLQKKNSQINECKTKIKALKKEIKEIENCLERISNIFKAKNPKNAWKRFMILYNNRDNLPEIISDFLKRLKPNFHKTINHLKNKLIPSTNNTIECYFGVTLPDYLKRRYRTTKGLEQWLNLAKLRWHSRNIHPIIT
jgi:hypothetical protein